MTMMDDLVALPFTHVKEKLDDLLLRARNLCEREPKRHLAYEKPLREIVSGQLTIAANTFRAIRYLLAEEPEDCWRRPEFALAAAPMVRSLVDGLFVVTFVVDDPSRADWMQRSAWQERRDERAHVRETYKARPEWQAYLLRLDEWIERYRKEWSITDKDVPWWPNPGKMPKKMTEGHPRRRMLEFIHDVMYADLSAASHVKWWGMHDGCSGLLLANEDERQRVLKTTRTAHAVWSLGALLAMLSEIDLGIGFGLRQDLRYLWTLFRESAPLAKELYDDHYRDRLGEEPSAP